MLAFEGKIDFTTKTNPFGAKPALKPAKKQSIDEQRALLFRMKMDARDAMRHKNEEAEANV